MSTGTVRNRYVIVKNSQPKDKPESSSWAGVSTIVDCCNNLLDAVKLAKTASMKDPKVKVYILKLLEVHVYGPPEDVFVHNSYTVD